MGKLDLGQWTIAFVLDSGQVDRSSGCGQPSEIFHPGVNDMTILYYFNRHVKAKKHQRFFIFKSCNSLRINSL